MQDLSIRSLSGADRHLMDRLGVDAFGSDWKVGTAHRFLGRIDCECWGAFRGETLVGFLIALKLGKERDIVSIAVDPTIRRQGIARQLLKFLISPADIACVFLEVEVSNVAALGLYRGLGYSQVGIRRGYYAGTRDAYVLRWERG